MKLSIKRVYAIFQKDLKDLSKNMFICTTFIMPIFLAIFYGRMGNVPIEVHYLLINLSLILAATFIQCVIIAEEKERNTLRGLMLSPATIMDILTGKSLVSFIFTIITIIICAMLSGYEPANFMLITIAIIVSTFFYIALGTLLVLLTKSVMEASVIILPFMFIFGFGSFIEPLIEKYPMLTFTKYMPNIQLVDLANKVQAGSGMMDVWSNIGIILGWFIVTAAFVVIVFKRKELDD